jgi:hypothetical protein
MPLIEVAVVVAVQVVSVVMHQIPVPEMVVQRGLLLYGVTQHITAVVVVVVLLITMAGMIKV